MKLFNGYGLETEAKSYAYISLDGTKAVKMDAGSIAEVRESGKHLEVDLKTGGLFFDVSEPLKADETMTIRTSSMIVGIRGTSGITQVVSDKISVVYVLTGEVAVIASDPISGAMTIEKVYPHERATVYIQNAAQGGKSAEIIKDRFGEADIPGFAAVEVEGSAQLREKLSGQGYATSAITGGAQARLRSDEASASARIGAAPSGTGTQSVQPLYAAASDASGSLAASAEALYGPGSGAVKNPDPPQEVAEQISQVEPGETTNLPNNSVIPLGEAALLRQDANVAVPEGAQLTVNGELDVAGGGQLTVGGNVVNNAPNTIINRGIVVIEDRGVMTNAPTGNYKGEEGVLDIRGGGTLDIRGGTFAVGTIKGAPGAVIRISGNPVLTGGLWETDFSPNPAAAGTSAVYVYDWDKTAAKWVARQNEDAGNAVRQLTLAVSAGSVTLSAESRTAVVAALVAGAAEGDAIRISAGGLPGVTADVGVGAYNGGVKGRRDDA
jgi:hypothetical protein